MKSLTLVCVILFSTVASFGQVAGSASSQAAAQAQLIERVCRGSEVTSGPEYDAVQRIKEKLGTVINRDRQHMTYIALAKNNEINAWATNFNMTVSLICVPVEMVHFMGSAEGELAFIIAHEVGHTVDDVCKTQNGRVAVANSRGSLGALFGGWVAHRVQRLQVKSHSRGDVKQELTTSGSTSSPTPGITLTTQQEHLGVLKCTWVTPAQEFLHGSMHWEVTIR